MDPVSQALLGAACGQVAFADRLGRRALAWGAVAGVLPDLDVVAIATHGPFGEFLYHRGPTHALWFGPVVGPGLGWATWRWHSRRGTPGAGDRAALPAWMGLFALALFTHPLLDVFTAYGTQLLAPFDLTRFAWNGIAIIDPLYTLTLGLAVAVGVRAATRPSARRAAAAVGLTLTTAYLLYGVSLNRQVEHRVRSVLAAEGVRDASVRAYPTLLQPWLRRVVARSEDHVRVGLVSTWRPEHLVWDRFPVPPPHPLVDRLAETWEGSVFVWFAMGQVHPRVTRAGRDTVVELEDLRYGLPGQADRGLWGIRGVFDRAGRLRGRVERYNRRDAAARRIGLGDLWRATWGDLSSLSR